VVLDLNHNIKKKLLDVIKDKDSSLADRLRIRRRIVRLEQLQSTLELYNVNFDLLISVKTELKTCFFLNTLEFYNNLRSRAGINDAFLRDSLDDNDTWSDEQTLKVGKYIKKIYLSEKRKPIMSGVFISRKKLEQSRVDFFRMLDNYARFMKRRLRCRTLYNQLVLALRLDEENIKK
jgi:hypothetical protein